MFEIKEFSGKQEGEKVEIFVRSHPLYLLWRLLPPALLLAAGVGAGLVLLNAFPSISGGVIFLGLCVLFLPVLWLAWRFALWYYDYFIVTDRRVVDFVARPFLSESRNDTQLSRIQDAQVVFPNALAVLFNYGHVIVQTAGMVGQLSFRYAARPNELQAKLLDLVVQNQAVRAEQGPLSQLVAALRDSLDSQQRIGDAGSPPSAPPAAPRKLSPPASRRLKDVFLVRATPGANVKTWRKHWLILLKMMLRPALLIAAALGALIVIPGLIIGWLAVPVLVVGSLYLAWQIADWYNDVYVVTEDRIIDVEKVPFISEDRREARLIMIQDVNYNQPNFISRLFNFGDVIVQTAGRTGAFTFNSVPDPRGVQKEIFARWELARQAQQAPVSAKTAQEFFEVMDRYHEARHKKAP